jgi:hypothetical protein
VRLPDRGGRQRLLVEASKGALHTALELGLDRVAHNLGGKRWGGVLQLDQLDSVIGREQVGARRGKLADFDERRP